MSDISRYKGKLFSILGDSISTLEGYSEPEYAEYYTGYRKIEADIYAPDETWWGRVTDALGGELLVNNSISGSTVCKRRIYKTQSYGCSDERTAAMCRYGLTPDVIMVFMGENDWGCGIRIAPRDEGEAEELSVFSVAYREMLRKLRANCPEAEIWCFTLPVSTRKNNPDYVFPYCIGGRHIEEYCEAIKVCAEENGCRVIDLYRHAEPFDTVDDFHPNYEGMKTIADAVLKILEMD